ncbi:MAG: molybdopterin-guanine dinucleotide biosynthesis protein B [Betaproteobacteria bacterium]|nr:molybdopterin-guanine dinucleotide biosynthesis protein B [Betaproteobacteria bacterium]
MKILGIAGYSGAGKTTLVEKLLAAFGARGVTVSVIKQSHHDVEVDRPGKDSWRHRQAGAHEVMLTSPHRWMLVGELRGAPEPGLDALLARLSPCDLVLVEGFRHADLPKLEVWRSANGQPWLHPTDARVIAIASDGPPPGDLPHFDLDDSAAIAAFILDTLDIPC